jgi:hypothetical protein
MNILIRVASIDALPRFLNIRNYVIFEIITDDYTERSEFGILMYFFLFRPHSDLLS